MRRALIAALVAPLLALAPMGRAQADPALLVSPTRVVFDGNKRTAVLTLLNNGTDVGTYRLFLVHYHMREDGAFEDVPQPSTAELAVDRMIRFTPKQVVLPPKQAQVVRVQLRLPANLADGEYRTHLLFRVLPVEQAHRPDDGRGVSIKLTPAVGISIPLIIRHGASTATASLSGLTLLPPGGPANAPLRDRNRLVVTLGRGGNQSIYGNLVATFKGATGGVNEVARANGLAVYLPLADRKVTLPLQGPLTHGRLSVVYQEPEPGGKVLARTEIVVP